MSEQEQQESLPSLPVVLFVGFIQRPGLCLLMWVGSIVMCVRNPLGFWFYAVTGWEVMTIISAAAFMVRCAQEDKERADADDD